MYSDQQIYDCVAKVEFSGDQLETYLLQVWEVDASTSSFFFTFPLDWTAFVSVLDAKVKPH